MKCTATILACLVATIAAKYTGPTNGAGLNLIKKYEGYSSNFYRDPGGIKTIGYGHACDRWSCAVPLKGKYRVPLTPTSAEALLKEDLAHHENCVANLVTYDGLTASQFSALASFTFEQGCDVLKSSNLLKKVNTGYLVGAADEFAWWTTNRGKYYPGLVRRRAAEKELFCSGGECGNRCNSIFECVY